MDNNSSLETTDKDSQSVGSTESVASDVSSTISHGPSALSLAEPLSDQLRDAFNVQWPFVSARHDILLVMPIFTGFTDMFGEASLSRHSLLKLPADAHIFSICAWCKWRAIDVSPQVIVLSGLCGAGKSTVKRRVFDYLIHTDKTNSFNNVDVCLRLIEDFGSRISDDGKLKRSAFGALTNFHLGIGGAFLGSSLQTTLLAKWSFLKGTAEAELDMSFRIFDTMLSGSNASFLKLLKLQRNPQHYPFLYSLSRSQSGSLTNDAASTYRSKLVEFKNALQAMNLDQPFCHAVFQLLAVQLKLGNLAFTTGFALDGTMICTIANEYELTGISELLGCDVEKLRSCLMRRSVVVREQTSVVDLDASKSHEAAVNLARNMYARLFQWLVSKYNSRFRFQNDGVGAAGSRTLGVWDAYGFSTDKHNSYQEFLLNYLNEKVNEFMRHRLLREYNNFYREEGIEYVADLQYLPNLVVKPMESVLQSFDVMHRAEPKVKDGMEIARLSNSQPESWPQTTEFIIQHFLFEVKYSCTDFTKKSYDRISPEVSEVLYSARNPLCPAIFPEGNPALSSIHRRTASLSTQALTAAAAILDRMKKRQCTWIVCVKPSFESNSRFDHSFVSHQLHSYQVPEIIASSPSTFDHVEDISSWFHRYRMLSRSTWPRFTGSCQSGVESILHSSDIPNSEIHLGKRSIFVKQLETIYKLEQRRLEELHRLATLVQRYFRQWSKVHISQRAVQSQITISRCWRGYRARKDYRRHRGAVCTIQAFYRGWKLFPSIDAIFGNKLTTQKMKKARQYYSVLLEKVAFMRIHRVCLNFCARYYLLLRGQHLPSASPTCTEWPEVPFQTRFRVADRTLRVLYHRWRCKVYRQNVNQQEYFRYREKLAASVLFKDRKAAYTVTVSHPFRGDYVQIKQNPKWRKISHDTHDQYVVFSDVINKVHRSNGKVSSTVIVISTKGVATLDPRNLHLRYRIPVGCLERITLSPFCDTVCVFHLNDSSLSKHGGDFIFESRHVIELVSKLYLVYQNATGRCLTVDIEPIVMIECQDELVELVFHQLGDDEPAVFSTSCFQANTGPSCTHRSKPAGLDASAAAQKLAKALPIGNNSPLFGCYEPPDYGYENELPPDSGDETEGAPLTTLSFQQPVRFMRKGDRLEVHF